MLAFTLHSLASEAGSGFEGGSSFEDDVAPTSLLNPGSSPDCQAPCAKYHAGATPSMEFVCQYQASGLSVTEMQTTGVACLPPSLRARGDGGSSARDQLSTAANRLARPS